MQELQGRVAVVTGAASGIGWGLAERFAREGMKVVLADVEDGALAAASEKIGAAGADVLAVKTDVSQWESVERLADAAYERFGAVHIVCNNAGVGGTGVFVGGIWDRDPAEWRWIMGVNLWGVIHGVHAFLPRMLRGGDEGHVVNTASAAGIVYGNGIYGVTKHAVVALSEAVHTQLQAARAKVGVSVVCPGWVKTNIMDSARNLPPELASTRTPSAQDVERRDMGVRTLERNGIEPSEVADEVVAAVREQRFYVLPMQREFRQRIDEVVRGRAEDIVEQRNPRMAGGGGV
jgi:NAD(P)-dependent dehydrogenase (short-subunit alcohol dehydrogenase family)